MKSLITALALMATILPAAAEWDGGLKTLPEGCEKASTSKAPVRGRADLQGIAHCKSGMVVIAIRYTEVGIAEDFGGHPVVYEDLVEKLPAYAGTMAGLIPKGFLAFVLYPPGADNFSGKEIGGFMIKEGIVFPALIVNEGLKRRNEEGS